MSVGLCQLNNISFIVGWGPCYVVQDYVVDIICRKSISMQLTVRIPYKL